MDVDYFAHDAVNMGLVIEFEDMLKLLSCSMSSRNLWSFMYTLYFQRE